MRVLLHLGSGCHEGSDTVRDCNCSIHQVRFVVLLYIFQFVHVVHHEAQGLLQSLLALVAQEVDLVHLRAVSDVKIGNWIKCETALLLSNQVMGAEPRQEPLDLS